ncbi:MAG: FAD-binding protein [Promethearchaeota archaeon]
MPEVIVHQDKIQNPEEIVKICPFGALEVDKNSQVLVNAACKLCKVCTNKYPEAFTLKEDVQPEIDKSEWKGIAVYVEHDQHGIHPVTFELLGKARELADKINHPVIALSIGSNIKDDAKILWDYGAENVFVYDYPDLVNFRIEPYAACFEDFILKHKPSTILVGGTTVGRSLAPRVAARIHTGLTADCTRLDMQENTDLDQIRPAFGGNIMAHIRTPNHRPQFATVRYKIFSALDACIPPDDAQITICEIDPKKLKSNITIHKVEPIPKVKSIEDAEVILVAGRGVKKQEDLGMIQNLASALGAHVATTRPLIEAGWSDPKSQIGLSGRTVKPKLIITFGVSGSVQFRAGMENSELIISVNSDPNANMMKIAHIAIRGDLYKIIPQLYDKIKHYKPELCGGA